MTSIASWARGQLTAARPGRQVLVPAGAEIKPPIVVQPPPYPNDIYALRIRIATGREATEGEYWAIRGMDESGQGIDASLAAMAHAAATAANAVRDRTALERKFQDMVGSPPTDAEYWTLVGLNQQGENLDGHIRAMAAGRPKLEPVVFAPQTPISSRAEVIPRQSVVRVTARRQGVTRAPGRSLKALQVLIRGR